MLPMLSTKHSLAARFRRAHTTLGFAVLRQLGDTAGAAARKQSGGRNSVSERLTSRQPLSPPTHGRRLLGVGDLEVQYPSFVRDRRDANLRIRHYQLGLALSQKGEKEREGKRISESSGTGPTSDAAGTMNLVPAC